jgi:hypothetical protein
MTVSELIVVLKARTGRLDQSDTEWLLQINSACR